MVGGVRAVNTTGFAKSPFRQLPRPNDLPVRSAQQHRVLTRRQPLQRQLPHLLAAPARSQCQ